jgi:hypothetical protein
MRDDKFGKKRKFLEKLWEDLAPSLVLSSRRSTREQHRVLACAQDQTVLILQKVK